MGCSASQPGDVVESITLTSSSTSLLNVHQSDVAQVMADVGASAVKKQGCQVYLSHPYTLQKRMALCEKSQQEKS